MPRLLPLAALLALGVPALGDPLGFRTDGTGRYPDAAPPLEWGPKKNVVWKIDLKQSNAIPVLLGDKLFTCEEPCVLICLDKASGKVVWRKASSYEDLVLTPKEKALLEEEGKKDKELSAKQSTLEKESSALRKAIKDDPATKGENDKKLDELKKKTDAVRAERKLLTTHNRYLEPGKGAGGYHPTGGYTSPTPVTDGKHVYVVYGNGLVACHGLDGTRKWLKLVEHPTVSYGHGASPLLVKGRLLVHFSDLVALDVADGSEAWRAKIAPNHGTPMHARVGGEDVAVHPQGVVVRVRDGAVVAKGLGATGPNSPLVQDGKAYFVAGQVRGYDLPKDDASAKWVPLWKGANLKGGGYWFPSPVLHEGLIYAMNASAIFSVVDAKTGELVYERRLTFGGGQCYPSLSLAGGRLYASSDNGTTLVLKPGREYQELAKNELEPFRSSLVFEGKRMYVRTTKGLWCIGE